MVTPVPSFSVTLETPVKVRMLPQCRLNLLPRGHQEYSNQRKVRTWENDERTETRNQRQQKMEEHEDVEVSSLSFSEPLSFSLSSELL